MMTTTQNLTKFWGQDYNKIWFNAYELVPSQSPDIFNSEDASGDHYVKRASVVAPGLMQAMDEATPLPFDNFVDGPEKIIYPAKFGLQVQASWEAMQDDRQGILKQSLAMLGTSQKQTIEYATWDILNSGFGTTKLGIDNLALFSASHPLYGVPGGTTSNLHTGSLSRSTLQGAIKKFHTMVNDRNYPVLMEPAVLVIHPNLEWKAKELLMSPYDPESANRNINPIYNIGIRYYVSRYLTSETAWFLLTEKSFHDLRIVWFTKPKTGTHHDENVEATMFKVSMRFLATFWNWRGVVGSTGV